MEELLKKIDKEKENRFKKQWTKLDRGSKLDRLLLFVKMEKIEKTLSDNSENQLKSLLIQIHSSNLLNKSSEIDYDIDNSKIIQVHNLSFDEEQDKYIFNKPDKKIKKNTSQTNTSNLERHFNRSKKSTKTF